MKGMKHEGHEWHEASRPSCFMALHVFMSFM